MYLQYGSYRQGNVEAGAIRVVSFSAGRTIRRASPLPVDVAPVILWLLFCVVSVYKNVEAGHPSRWVGAG